MLLEVPTPDIVMDGGEVAEDWALGSSGRVKGGRLVANFPRPSAMIADGPWARGINLTRSGSVQFEVS